jgi:hypothetical protein
MSYERSDMYYEDYRWTQPESKAMVKQATSFDAANGNIILYLINLLTQNLFESNILEIILHEYVPNTIKTVKQVVDWIKEKGEHYYKLVLHSIAGSD